MEMDKESRLQRLTYVKIKYEKQQENVKILERHKISDEIIDNAKRLELSLKNEIAALETMLRAQGVKC